LVKQLIINNNKFESENAGDITDAAVQRGVPQGSKWSEAVWIPQSS